MKYYANIQKFLTSEEYKKKENIVFCVGDNNSTVLARNLIKSAQKVKLPIVLFALDRTIGDRLSGECDIINYESVPLKRGLRRKKFRNGALVNKEKEPEGLAGRGRKAGEWAFKQVVFQRFLITGEILKAGKSVIYLDTDIVVKQNFEKNVLDQYKDTTHECLMQWCGSPHGINLEQAHRLGKGDPCTGFYSARPTPQTLKIFSLKFLRQNSYGRYAHDQHFFNRVVWDHNLLDMKILNSNHYPTFNHYLKRMKRLKREDKQCKLVHFMGIGGNLRIKQKRPGGNKIDLKFVSNYKMKKMKTYNCWVD